MFWLFRNEHIFTGVSPVFSDIKASCVLSYKFDFNYDLMKKNVFGLPLVTIVHSTSTVFSNTKMLSFTNYNFTCVI